MIKQVTSRYFAQTQLDEESFLAIFEYRGPSHGLVLYVSMRKSETEVQRHVVSQCKDLSPR